MGNARSHTNAAGDVDGTNASAGGHQRPRPHHRHRVGRGRCRLRLLRSRANYRGKPARCLGVAPAGNPRQKCNSERHAHARIAGIGRRSVRASGRQCHDDCRMPNVGGGTHCRRDCGSVARAHPPPGGPGLWPCSRRPQPLCRLCRCHRPNVWANQPPGLPRVRRLRGPQCGPVFYLGTGWKISRRGAGHSLPVPSGRTCQTVFR